MAKSWKKFIPKPEETKGTGLVNENTSPEPLDFQKIIAQDEALAKLVKEREELEKKLKSEVSNTQISPEDQRFFNYIPTFAEKKKIDQQWLKKKELRREKKSFELKQKKKEERRFETTRKLKNGFESPSVANKLNKTNQFKKIEEKSKGIEKKVSEKNKHSLKKKEDILTQKDSIKRKTEKEKKPLDVFTKRELIKNTVEKDRKPTDKTLKRDLIKTTVERFKKPLDTLVKKEVDRQKTTVKKVKDLFELGKQEKKKVEKEAFQLREKLKKQPTLDIVRDFSTKKSPNLDQIRDVLKEKKILEKIKEKAKPVEKVKERAIKIKDDWEKIKEKKKEIVKIKENIKDKFDKGFDVKKLIPMDKFTNSFDKNVNLDAMNDIEKSKNDDKIAEEKKEKQKEERLAQLREERKKEQQEEQKREERKARKKDKFND